MTEYLVGDQGIDYIGTDGEPHRAEPGDTVDDLPADALGWLMAGHHIADVSDLAAVSSPDDVPSSTGDAHPVDTASSAPSEGQPASSPTPEGGPA